MSGGSTFTRFFTSISTIYQQDENRFLFLAGHQWNERPFVFVSPFHARQVQEPVQSRTQDSLSAAQINVGHGGAAQLGKTGRRWDHLAKKNTSLSPCSYWKPS